MVLCAGTLSLLSRSDDGSQWSGDCSGYFSCDDQRVQPQQVRDDVVRDDDDDDYDELMMLCEEDMMLTMTPPSPFQNSINHGDDWLSALCPCCRLDASDDSIDLQEMIKLEPIKASVYQTLSPLA